MVPHEGISRQSRTKLIWSFLNETREIYSPNLGKEPPVPLLMPLRRTECGPDVDLRASSGGLCVWSCVSIKSKTMQDDCLETSKPLMWDSFRGVLRCPVWARSVGRGVIRQTAVVDQVGGDLAHEE